MDNLEGMRMLARGEKILPEKNLESAYYLLRKHLNHCVTGRLGSTDGTRRDSSPTDKRSARSKDIMQMDPGPTKPRRSDARRNGSPEDSKHAMSKDSDHADGMGQKDAPGKEIGKAHIIYFSD
jgi:hypothetical protein